MSHLVLELLLWIVFTFFVGCILGCVFRRLFGPEPELVVATATGKPPAAARSSAAPAVTRSTVETAKPAMKAAPPAPVSSGKPQQPKGIAAPRSGKPDNLRRVSGIGPKIERTLHGLGYFHFDQIASWTPDEVRWVDEHLKFKGRIARDDWQGQARLLAGGKIAAAAESEAGKKQRRRKPPVRKRARK
jgi:NADH-quinone oxidoreductase subunit E